MPAGLSTYRKEAPLPSSEVIIPAVLTLLFLVNAASRLEIIWEGIHSLARLVAYLALGMLLLFHFIGNFKKAIFPYIFSLFLLLWATMLNDFLFPTTAYEAVGIILQFAVLCLPVCIVASSVVFPSKLYRILLEHAKFISFIVFILLIIRFLIPSSASSGYSMGLGYAILPYLAVSLTEAVAGESQLRRRVLYFSLSVIMLSGVLLLCSRGPLVCVAILAVCLMVQKIITKGVSASFLIGILTMLALCVAYKEVLGLVSDALALTGFSRTGYLIDQFLESGQIHVSGRDVVQAPLIEAVVQNPLSARGIGADRVDVGMNAHNIFLEVAYCFGVVAAIVAVVFLFCYCIAVFRATSSPYGKVLTVFFSCSVPYLMFSGSMWNSILFWIGIGLLLSFNRWRKASGNPEEDMDAFYSLPQWEYT